MLKQQILPIRIGIAGVSRAGKSHLARRLKATLEQRGASVRLIHQDNYVKAPAQIPKILDQVDWEHPDSIDLPAYLRELQQLDDSTDFLIAEGLLNFYFPACCQCFDKALFVEISSATFFQRKAQDFRWGVQPDWFKQHIWDSYLKYGKVHHFSHAPHRVDGAQAFDPSAILEALRI
ncbi:MAG: hypothetical protein AAF985_09390 [Bacteroidota bacterium]